ncbi:metallophosphoesterase family protein [Chelativorans sp.]|uniref:metallophosphoesterase family protein n=1 Tax=Chelativorans sp. TaxID=2203393 RepID=UPI002812679A|nr:metallophosphoesterase family protein [Chelativorans sp.]
MPGEGIRYDEASTPAGMRVYAIGDIHGRYDLLAEMHRRIMAEIIDDRPEDWRIICLGDYVDRGPESRQVLEFLSRSSAADPRIICLAGNHDLGFLSFLAQPRAEGLFANNGGDATARSYGVELQFSPREALQRGHAALMEAIPQEHLDFLHGLKLSASFGDLFFCHAGIRPGIPLDVQSAEDLIWIRERFRHDPTLHPKLVVHGHTPQRAPEIMPNRVNLDTGAWHSGRLTAMMFEGRRKRLLEVAG